MRSRLTTVLSLSGVLAAGSAAAIINTQVLTAGADSKSGAVTAVADSVQETTILPVGSTLPVVTTLPAATTLPPETTLAAETPPPAESVAPVAAPASPVQTQGIYQIGDAGLVTLDTAGDVLTIVSASPNAGWTVARAENDGSLNAEVTLQSDTTLVEFRANLLFGVISTSIESKNLATDNGAGNPSGPSASAGTTVPQSHNGGDDAGGDDHGGDDGGADHGGGDD